MIISGLQGNVLVGGAQFPFGKWNGTITCKQITRNNWINQPYQRLVSGFIDGRFDIEGPADVGNTPLTAGNTYVFTFQWTAALGIVVTCNVEVLNPTNDAEDAPNYKCTVKSTGAFVAAIL